MLGSKNDRKIVEKIMFETDCLQFAERDINSISVGERQRVFIARALASEPDLLLLDEPGSSLDLHHSVEIYRLLEKLNFECGITVIVVSHNLNITAQFAKRVIFLHKGEIIADDTPSGALIHKNLSMAYGDSFDLLEGEKSKRPVIIPRRL
jgi:iron complex transport system ATP-binding protein